MSLLNFHVCICDIYSMLVLFFPVPPSLLVIPFFFPHCILLFSCLLLFVTQWVSLRRLEVCTLPVLKRCRPLKKNILSFPSKLGTNTGIYVYKTYHFCLFVFLKERKVTDKNANRYLWVRCHFYFVRYHLTKIWILNIVLLCNQKHQLQDMLLSLLLMNWLII